MRDYQPERNNPYWLPQTLYRRVLALIRDYDRMVEERRNIPTNTSSGGQGGSGTGDRTGSAGVRAAEIAADISAIDHAMETIPQEYRGGVWQSAAYGMPYPKDAARKTYSRQKGRFIYHVAVNKGWISPE